MRFRYPAKWNNVDNLSGLLFFVQRLEELTFPYTLDSYKSSAMSLQSLILEARSLLEMIDGAEQRQIDKIMNSVEHVLSEFAIRLKGNWIAKNVCSIDIDSYVTLNKSSFNLNGFIRNLDVLYAELEDEAYFAEIADSVIKLAAEPRQKKKLDLLAKEFATFLQNRGVSRDHINGSVVEFFFGERDINNPSQFKDFCQIVYPHYHDFIVIFGTSDILLTIDQNILYGQGIFMIDDEFRGIPVHELSALLDKENLIRLVAILVQATDYNSAVSLALTKLESFYNFYRIFNHKEELHVTSHALVEQKCCEGIRKKVETPKNNMHFIRDMRSIKAATTLKRFMSRTFLNRNEDRTKFINIVNIHGMSLETKSHDIQLVNLWTCLETVAPGDRASSKISNIVNRIIPVIMLGYYNRLIVNLLFDILRWDRRVLTNIIKTVSAEDTVDLKEKFIALLTTQENEAALSQLYSKCRNFELLRYRISELSTVLKDVGKSEAKIKMHEKMVRWQLHRIYRTRNRIVHAGDSPTFTKYLVENAHDYFDQTLLFCLEVSSRKRGFDTFLMCFDFADVQYKIYMDKFKNQNSRDIVWTIPKSKGRAFIFSEED